MTTHCQSYDFSNNHVGMWELEHRDCVLKNWWFWIVVLEKTLRSPLDCKEIKPINPKENQPWVFIGRTDAEAEAPILWPPDAKSRLTGKDSDAGKVWMQKEKGVAEDKMARQHHQINGHEFEQTPGESRRQRNLASCNPWAWLSKWTTVTTGIFQDPFQLLTLTLWKQKLIEEETMWLRRGLWVATSSCSS